jgi:hypothetical protein
LLEEKLELLRLILIMPCVSFSTYKLFLSLKSKTYVLDRKHVKKEFYVTHM